MKILTYVTATGADDQTRYNDLEDLSRSYPHAEWGILFSRTQQGHGRFPSLDWLRGLADYFTDRNIAFAGHLCGSYVNDFLSGRWVFSDLAAIHPKLPGLFKRWQINTHGQSVQASFSGMEAVLPRLAELGQTVIFQWDDANDDLIRRFCGRYPENTSALLDLSHGAGILPSEWRRPVLDASVGFAGGLSPANVAAQMRDIAAAMQGYSKHMTWIDAETKLRNNDVFNLGLVGDFLRASAPFVKTGVN